MKKYLLLLFTVFACNSRTPEQKLIVDYMKESVDDPSSYEPISFEVIGPYNFNDLGLIPGDTVRRGKLILHTFRTKNEYGALKKNTLLFTYNKLTKRVTKVDDKTSARLQNEAFDRL